MKPPIGLARRSLGRHIARRVSRPRVLGTVARRPVRIAYLGVNRRLIGLARHGLSRHTVRRLGHPPVFRTGARRPVQTGYPSAQSSLVWRAVQRHTAPGTLAGPRRMMGRLHHTPIGRPAPITLESASSPVRRAPDLPAAPPDHATLVAGASAQQATRTPTQPDAQPRVGAGEPARETRQIDTVARDAGVGPHSSSLAPIVRAARPTVVQHKPLGTPARLPAAVQRHRVLAARVESAAETGASTLELALPLAAPPRMAGTPASMPARPPVRPPARSPIRTVARPTAGARRAERLPLARAAPPPIVAAARLPSVAQRRLLPTGQTETAHEMRAVPAQPAPSVAVALDVVETPATAPARQPAPLPREAPTRSILQPSSVSERVKRLPLARPTIIRRETLFSPPRLPDVVRRRHVSTKPDASAVQVRGGPARLVPPPVARPGTPEAAATTPRRPSDRRLARADTSPLATPTRQPLILPARLPGAVQRQHVSTRPAEIAAQARVPRAGRVPTPEALPGAAGTPDVAEAGLPAWSQESADVPRLPRASGAPHRPPAVSQRTTTPQLARPTIAQPQPLISPTGPPGVVQQRRPISRAAEPGLTLRQPVALALRKVQRAMESQALATRRPVSVTGVDLAPSRPPSPAMPVASALTRRTMRSVASPAEPGQEPPDVSRMPSAGRRARAPDEFAARPTPSPAPPALVLRERAAGRTDDDAAEQARPSRAPLGARPAPLTSPLAVTQVRRAKAESALVMRRPASRIDVTHRPVATPLTPGGITPLARQIAAQPAARRPGLREAKSSAMVRVMRSKPVEAERLRALPVLAITPQITPASLAGERRDIPATPVLRKPEGPAPSPAVEFFGWAQERLRTGEVAEVAEPVMLARSAPSAPTELRTSSLKGSMERPSDIEASGAEALPDPATMRPASALRELPLAVPRSTSAPQLATSREPAPSTEGEGLTTGLSLSVPRWDSGPAAIWTGAHAEAVAARADGTAIQRSPAGDAGGAAPASAADETRGTTRGPASLGSPTREAGQQEGAEAVDLDTMAREVYQILRRRLRVEQERAVGIAAR